MGNVGVVIVIGGSLTQSGVQIKHLQEAICNSILVTEY